MIVKILFVMSILEIGARLTHLLRDDYPRISENTKCDAFIGLAIHVIIGVFLYLYIVGIGG